MQRPKLATLLVLADCWTGSPPPAPLDRPAPPAMAKQPGTLLDFIDLEQDTAAARADAKRQMTERCGDNNFTILHEGLEEIARNVGSADIVMAWRIYYQCNS